jgi:lipid-A-disaccharide synthase
MQAATELIRETIPDAQFVLPVAPTFTLEEVRERLGPNVTRVVPIEGDASETFAICDIVMVASGTATLQSALIGTPMIIAYKVSPLTYWIGRFLLNIDRIGLVNIVEGEKFIPEFIQSQVTPRNLADAIIALFSNRERLDEMKGKMKGVRMKLTGRKASERAADAILRLLDRGRKSGASSSPQQ